jgi:hypothetical protein
VKYHPLPLTRRWIEDYRRWRSENAPKPPAKPLGSPPDLQKFIREHGDWRRLPPDYFDRFPPEERERHWQNVRANGAYSVITRAEWAEWDRLNEDWQARRPGR